MTKKDIFVVACKLFGIYLLVRGLDLFAQNFPFLVPVLTKGFEGIWYLLVALVTFALYIGGAFYLIKWAEPIGARLCAEEKSPGTSTGLDRDVLLTIAFSAMGVFIIAAALPQLPGIIINLSSPEFLPRSAIRGTWGRLIGFVLQLVIGTYLFLGSKGMVALLKRAKSL